MDDVFPTNSNPLDLVIEADNPSGVTVRSPFREQLAGAQNPVSEQLQQVDKRMHTALETVGSYWKRYPLIGLAASSATAYYSTKFIGGPDALVMMTAALGDAVLRTTRYREDTEKAFQQPYAMKKE